VRSGLHDKETDQGGGDSRGECRSLAVHSESRTDSEKRERGQVSEALEPVREAAEAFVAELQHWRDVAGLARKRLSEKMAYDPSYVGKVESGGARPTEDFARRADQTLHAGGAIVRRWKEYDLAARRAGRHDQVDEPIPVQPMPQPAGGLLVEHDHAELHYSDGKYHAIQRRRIRNVGADPVTRYLIRISVDRHPGDPERSKDLYRHNPLTWDELAVHARAGDDQMMWKAKMDRDAFKEVWLLFENEHGRFPLYPGESRWIEYGYTVSEDKWGDWFQRSVRLPTQRLSVELRFPAALDPAVWGMETSMTAEAYPFRTAIEQEEHDGFRVFSWATDNPPMHARYRLEWHFRGRRTQEPPAVSEPKPSEKMAAIGIVQDGDPILHEVARPFDLPAEAEDARRVVAHLHSAIGRADTIHNFTKGMGVAAPQIGISRAAAIVRTPEGQYITLLNPQIIDESAETDEQYEGCWSFFDVRGKVPRSLSIEIEHQDVDGTFHITRFERNIARLVSHEIDHLNGMLYTARMRPNVEPIPVSQYGGPDRTWTYR
jgi:peptide deformylase